MDRADAIARIVQMQKMIERDSTSAQEKATAAEMIVRLKAQFSLDDRAIKRAMDIEAAGGADVTFFGGKIFFYEQRIKPHLDTVREEVDKALAKIAQQNTQEQVRLLAKLYDDLRGLNEAGAKNASYRSPPVQRMRNEAVKKLYAEELAKLDGTFSRQSRHEWAVMHVRFTSELTTQQIEAIVGVHSDDHIWEELEADLVGTAHQAGCTCPQPYWKGKRKKQRINEGINRGTRYFPRELSHQMQCPLSPHHAYYLARQAEQQEGA